MDILNLCSPCWEPEDSYGRLAVEMASTWHADGLHVNCFGGDPPEKQIIRMVVGGILMAYPTNWKLYPPIAAQVGPRVAVTMFESTRLPPGWCEELNKCRAVIVPSQWLVPVFSESGVTVPIYCLPLGISAAYRRVIRGAKADRPYTFLAIGDRGERKGWHLAGFAFQKAFGDDPAYRLIIKTRPGSLPFGISNPNIELLEGDYSDAEMAALYARCDAMVFPSAGEGFGLPPREFAATGGTAIATDWSGTADELSLWGLPITYRIGQAWPNDAKLCGLGEWAYPDVDDLARTMQTVAEHRDYYAQRASRIRRVVGALYSWKTFARGVYRIWRKYGDGYSTN